MSYPHLEHHLALFALPPPWASNCEHQWHSSPLFHIPTTPLFVLPLDVRRVLFSALSETVNCRVTSSRLVLFADTTLPFDDNSHDCVVSCCIFLTMSSHTLVVCSPQRRLRILLQVAAAFAVAQDQQVRHFAACVPSFSCTPSNLISSCSTLPHLTHLSLRLTTTRASAELVHSPIRDRCTLLPACIDVKPSCVIYAHASPVLCALTVLRHPTCHVQISSTATHPITSHCTLSFTSL